MTVFKCKMCGGNLEIQEGMTVCECDYCGTEQTLPKVNDERIQNLFNRANLLRLKAEFDKAAEIYEKIIQNNEEEAEAYWGLILCKYGVEYVEDPVSLERIPTCHRASFDAVTSDEDYKAALKYSDAQQRGVYEKQAKQIEQIQKEIIEIAQNEKPYDVFICYKETDENGKRTQDSVIANDIYHQLVQEGYKVFYAAITLEDKLGREYEPYIFSALNSAKVLLAIGTKPEYFNAVWVKNEWSRFLKIMKNDRTRLLIPCYRDMDPYELPEEFAHLQAQDMSKIGFVNDLVRGIKKVVVSDKHERVLDSSNIQQVYGNSSMNALLDRGTMALEDHEWEKASDYFDQVLNIDARCGEAYLGRVLAVNKASNIPDFVDIRLGKYKSVTKKTYDACSTKDDIIEDVVKKYCIPKYFEGNDIRNRFAYNLGFESEAASRKEDYDKEKKYFDTDNLVSRTIQFLTGDKKSEFESAINKIFSELQRRIDVAVTSHDDNKNRVASAYDIFIQETIDSVRRQYDVLSKRREDDYQYAIKLQETATSDTEYDNVAKKYDEIGNYQDSIDRAKQCRNQAITIRSVANMKVAKARTKKITATIIISILCVIAIFVACNIAGNKKRAEVHQSIIGQTFDGWYRYLGGVYNNEVYYKIKIIDETHCSVEYRNKDSNARDYHGLDENATYTLTGGLSGIYFNWESEEVYHSAEDFKVIVDGSDITLKTSNFNSYKGMNLYKK